VIQVIGRHAPAVVGKVLRTKKILDWDQIAQGELRLCRVVDGDQIIDDALISASCRDDGGFIVDLSLHGGPRIVQRVLLLLKRLGVEIVDPGQLLIHSWPARNAVETEMFTLVVRAKTRRVASWLIRMVDVVTAQIEGIIQNIEAGNFESALDSLNALGDDWGKVGFILDGVRVVLIGEPNTGKSTLANTLCEREHAIVSEVPGTTRDWIEHPGAVKGIPFTYVDTAGIRESSDAIEQEAVRRAREQVGSADIVLRLIDATVSPTSADLYDIKSDNLIEGAADMSSHHLYVWNKCDLEMHPDHKPLIKKVGDSGVMVSAFTGVGIEALRNRLFHKAGLADFDEQKPVLFTGRQMELRNRAVAALTEGEQNGPKAVRWLRYFLNNQEIRPDDGL